MSIKKETPILQLLIEVFLVMRKNGFGGANTNKSGLKFEFDTDFSKAIVDNPSLNYILKEHTFRPDFEKPIKSTTDSVFDVVEKGTNEIVGIITKQYQFYNVLMEQYNLGNIHSKKWKPDEVFFNLKRKTVFIVEKKWQETTGSVDEKLFGFNAKRILYQEIFNQRDEEPNIPIEFATLLNSDFWLYGNYIVKGHQKHRDISYHDYFNSLRNNGVRIMFDKYDFWWFGL